MEYILAIIGPPINSATVSSMLTRAKKFALRLLPTINEAKAWSEGSIPSAVPMKSMPTRVSAMFGDWGIVLQTSTK